MKRFWSLLLSIAMIFVLSATLVAQAQDKKLKVFGAYATPLEEPWDGVIHAALQKAADAGKIEYTHVDNLGYSGDMETALRAEAEDNHPDVIFGDAFGNEQAVSAVAADYPDIAFVFGSSYGPSDPNLSVFDNWIHEPAYLSGLVAGSLSRSGIVGVVAAMPIPEVNRLVNAFTAGVKEVKPDAEVRVTFINSFYDPPTAKEAALAQIDSGADVLYAERDGVIEAAKEKGVYAISNMSDQSEGAPDTVVTGPVWNMEPTVDYVLKTVAAGVYTAQDLKDFSMMAKGGATLAALHDFESKLDPKVLDLVKQREDEIKKGLFRVDINEQSPSDAVEATPVAEMTAEATAAS